MTTNEHWYTRMGLRIRHQNLHDDGGDDKVASLLRHGRAWLFSDAAVDPLLQLEWCFGSPEAHQLAAEVTVHDDLPRATVSLGVPGAIVYLKIPIPSALHARLPLAYQRDRAAARVTGVRGMAGGLRWSVWEDSGQWRRSDPKWMRGSLNIVDAFLGPSRPLVSVLERTEVSVTMPEGSYLAKATREQWVWTRARWPWSRAALVRVRLEFDQPVPVPGRGEDAHSVDDDAIYATSLEAPTVADAVARFVASVSRDRDGWQPPAPT